MPAIQDGVPLGMTLEDQWSQALAEYDARRRNPRFIPGGADPNPDSLERLRAELIDPLQMETGALTGNYPPVARTTTPYAFHSLPGGGLERVNKLTGEHNNAISGVPQHEKLDASTQSRKALLESTLKGLQGHLLKNPDDPNNPYDKAEVIRSINNYQKQLDDLLGTSSQPPAGAAAFDELNDPFSQPIERTASNSNVPDHSSFIGTPGVTAFELETPRQTAPTKSTYDSPLSVRQAVRAGRISKQQGVDILKKNFKGFQ